MHLKKLRRAEAGSKTFGIFRVKKSRFYTKEIIFFPILGGGGAPPVNMKVNEYIVWCRLICIMWTPLTTNMSRMIISKPVIRLRKGGILVGRVGNVCNHDVMHDSYRHTRLIRYKCKFWYTI